MKDSPLVSVVIPVFNTQAYLSACLESVLNQTVRDIEVLLVDDGSTDGSLGVEEGYAARDDRVRVIRQSHARQGAARNAGLRSARGEFVYFMDSDDLIEPTLLEECLAACVKDGLEFVTFDGIGFLDDPVVDCTEAFTEISDRRNIADTVVYDGPAFWRAMMPSRSIHYVCWLALYRRRFLLENHLFFAEGVYFEDNDWVLRLFVAARRLRYLPKRLYRYRRRVDSTIHAHFNCELAESCFAVYWRFYDLLGLQSDDKRRAMVIDAAYSLGERFGQFDELEPDCGLVKQTHDFMACLFEKMDYCRGRSDYRELNWHLSTLMTLEQATRAWPGFSLPRALKREELLKDLLGGWMPRADERIGMYGVGKVCRLLMEGFSDHIRPTVLFETENSASNDLWGVEVRPIGEAAACGLDALIVSSTRYADEMTETAKSIVGNSVEVRPVFHAVLALEGWSHPDDGGDE